MRDDAKALSKEAASTADVHRGRRCGARCCHSVHWVATRAGAAQLLKLMKTVKITVSCLNTHTHHLFQKDNLLEPQQAREATTRAGAMDSQHSVCERCGGLSLSGA